jgi:purine-binding chemotaxis protein CheW
MTEALLDHTTSLAAPAPGQYLTFRLHEEDYGIEVIKIREIIGLLDVTRVPYARGFVRGVINLRGKVIPVVDLRAKFELPESPDTPQT